MNNPDYDDLDPSLDERGYVEDSAPSQREPNHTERPQDPGHQYLTVCCMNCGYQFAVPVYCGNRFCSVCSGRRRARTKRRIGWLVHNVKHPPKSRFKMITLSITSEASLPEMIIHIRNFFKLLRRTKYWQSHVDGGAFVIEVTGSPGHWHAHLHILCSATYMKWSILHKIWKGITKCTGVYIQNIPGKQAINYVTKYVTKSQCEEQWQWDVSKALKGTRLFQPFGTWYAVSNACPADKPPCPECKSNAWDIAEFAMQEKKWKT